MPIFHSLPLRRETENRLLATYRKGLSSHWGAATRSLAHLLGILGLGTGWSASERRFLSSSVRSTGLSMAERRGVHRLLNPAAFPLSHNILKNKALFARHVAATGLPAPETFDPQSEELEAWLAERSAILAKPGYSSKGKGIAAYTREREHWSGSQGRLSPAELTTRLETVLARHGVVQELVPAHPKLADLSPGALPTLRIVTCLDEQGEPEACAKVLRLGSGGERPVDNFNAGGLAVRLDEEGRCVAAFRASGASTESIAVHPATGARIVGREIEGVDEAVALALRAHATLPAGFTVVGWDIGLSDRGPVLIEGNWNPGTDIVQLVDGVGLDRTRLGELYRFHLAQLPDASWQQSRPIEW